METRKPSRTAVNTAVWRAMHTLLDDEPKILADPELDEVRKLELLGRYLRGPR